MLKEKKGVLATRSPHRPNPVGVTLARIERVDKKTRSVLLSACDLVQGTPVLDIKPYVPNYDTVEPCRVPSWIVETINTRNKVVFSQEATDSVMHNHLNSKLKLYKNEPELFIEGESFLLYFDTELYRTVTNSLLYSTSLYSALFEGHAMVQCITLHYTTLNYSTVQYSALH